MSNKIIKLNRGDSYEFNVKITKNDSNEPYMLEAGKDIVYFAVMFPHQSFDEVYHRAIPMAIKGYIAEDGDQDLSSGEIAIKIEPRDTIHFAPGVYYYTIKLLSVQEGTSRIVINDDNLLDVRTIVERTKFIVNE